MRLTATAVLLNGCCRQRHSPHADSDSARIGALNAVMNPTNKFLHPSIAPEVCFFPFADGAVLFREGSRRLLVLNSTSASIWCLFGEFGTARKVASVVADYYGIGGAQAFQDVEVALNHFGTAGMLNWPLAERGAPETPASLKRAENELHQPAMCHDSSAVVASLTETGKELPGWAVQELFELQGFVLEFRTTEPEIGRLFRELMEPFVCEPRVKPRLSLEVLPSEGDGDTYDILLNSDVYAAAKAWHETLPILFTLIFIHTTDALRDPFLFHAAALVKNGKAVLFPAEAGSGKTTLAGALAARGMKFFSDEITALDTDTLQIVPLPLPMSIKPGSVEVLEPYFPGLEAAPVHLRADGKRVRYLPPPTASRPEKGESASVDAIVFPRYQQGVETRLTPIEKSDAITRLAASGSSDRELCEKDIQAMIDVVENSECFELVLSNLERAVDLLGSQIWKSRCLSDSPQ